MKGPPEVPGTSDGENEKTLSATSHLRVSTGDMGSATNKGGRRTSIGTTLLVVSPHERSILYSRRRRYDKPLDLQRLALGRVVEPEEASIGVPCR